MLRLLCNTRDALTAELLLTATPSKIRMGCVMLGIAAGFA
jgi:hypothetical protein